VAGIAERDEVIQAVRLAIILEVGEGDDVVDVKIKYDSAAAAMAPIPAKGFLALPIPVRPAIIGMPPSPRRAVLPAAIAGFTLPLQAAFRTTEGIFACLARQA
jgi:hypothetical protein